MGYTITITAADDVETVLDPGGRSAFRDLLEENGLLGYCYESEIPTIERLANVPPLDHKFNVSLRQMADEIRRSGPILVEALW